MNVMEPTDSTWIAEIAVSDWIDFYDHQRSDNSTYGYAFKVTVKVWLIDLSVSKELSNSSIVFDPLILA